MSDRKNPRPRPGRAHPHDEALDHQTQIRTDACNRAYLDGRLSVDQYDLAIRDIRAWSGRAYDDAGIVLDETTDRTSLPLGWTRIEAD